MSGEREERITQESLAFYGGTLDWLKEHHARYADHSSHDLDAEERANAIWKLAGQSLALATALVDMLARGYTAQTLPTMRAIHEANRLLGAVCDLEEERITRRWLRDQEVKQAEAREAEQRQMERISAQMEAAGLEPLTTEVGPLIAHIYRGMSKAAHHRRAAVDEGIDTEARRMIYGIDPRVFRRLEFAVFAGALVQEVLLKVGDALCVLYGPQFYTGHLAPMLRRFADTLAALDLIDAADRAGL